MKVIPLPFLLLLVLLLAPSAASAQTTGVTIDQIRHCRAPWPICNDTLQADYHWWEDHGVPDQIQKNTLIGRYNEPAPHSVRNLVFVAAGQRLGNGMRSLVTGQPDFDDLDKDDPNRWMPVSDASIPFQMFDRGILSRNDTFVGLAYDARFNWGFTQQNKRDIVDAYYAWLKSKVHANNLRVVYLAGHSRGGALVMRLAQKFKQDFPNVILVVHTFDPVAVMQEGEMGTYSASIDNPVAGFPRDTNLLDNRGNWSWRSELHAQYANKRNYAFTNYLVGGNIFGLAQEVRSVTHESSGEATSSLGWYDHRWIDSDENAGGHVEISNDFLLIDDAMRRLQDRLDLFRNNMAPLATASASSTYCDALDCYSPARANDTDLDSRVGGSRGWTNSGDAASQWFELAWPGTIRSDRIELVTSDGFPLEDFRIQYRDGAIWRDATQVRLRLGLRHEVFTAPFETDRLRVAAMIGPAHQPQHVRINEILVRGEWIVPPNQPPVAQCAAATLESVPGRTLIAFDASGSSDGDGSIVGHLWAFEDGSTENVQSLQRTFWNPNVQAMWQWVALTVTDDDGAIGQAGCYVHVPGYCPTAGWGQDCAE